MTSIAIVSLKVENKFIWSRKMPLVNVADFDHQVSEECFPRLKDYRVLDGSQAISRSPSLGHSQES